jgi:hypothetical protein
MILDAYDVSKAKVDMKTSKVVNIDGKGFEVKKDPCGYKYITIEKVKIVQKP